MVLWFLALVFPIVSVCNPTSIEVNVSSSSPSYCDAVQHRFQCVITNTCPVEFNSACVDPIFDPKNIFEHRCSVMPPMFDGDPTVLVLNSTVVLGLLKYKDPLKRPWCMLTMFYAHECPFSAKLAPHFNHLARLYPTLVSVAVDATDFSKLNFRYGVSGTPTVLLWVSGVGVARMDDFPWSLQGLMDFVESRTDLKARPPMATNVENDVGSGSSVEEVTKSSLTIESEEESAGYEPDIEEFPSELIIHMSDRSLYKLVYVILCYAVCTLTVLYTYRGFFLYNSRLRASIVASYGRNAYDNLLFLFYLAPPADEQEPFNAQPQAAPHLPEAEDPAREQREFAVVEDPDPEAPPRRDAPPPPASQHPQPPPPLLPHRRTSRKPLPSEEFLEPTSVETSRLGESATSAGAHDTSSSDGSVVWTDEDNMDESGKYRPGLRFLKKLEQREQAARLHAENNVQNQESL